MRTMPERMCNSFAERENNLGRGCGDTAAPKVREENPIKRRNAEIAKAKQAADEAISKKYATAFE